MQSAAPEAVDLSSETDETQALYGLDQAGDRGQRPQLSAGAAAGRARRAVRAAVHGLGQQVGRAQRVEGNHASTAGRAIEPIAGLLKDLKRRGLLDSTLVVWGGEFGRTPMSESGNGRDHNPFGFTMWMAGGGVKGGHGLRRDRRNRPVRRGKQGPRSRHARHHLRCLGLDHEQLTFRTMAATNG